MSFSDAFLDRVTDYGKAPAEATFPKVKSGWNLLITDINKLQAAKAVNDLSPLIITMNAMIYVIVSKLVYFLDNRNHRSGVFRAFLNHLINWDFRMQNLS